MNRTMILLMIFSSFSVLSSPLEKDEINQFLSELHTEPQRVMNEIPKKEGDIYLSHKQEILFKDRNQARDMIIEKSNTVISPRVSIDYAVDDPARLVDSGHHLLRNLHTLHALVPNEKRLEKQPWSDSYWPLYSGGIALRYADEEIQGQSWQQFFDLSNIIKPWYSYGGLERDKLSPSEKYDLLVGDDSFSLTHSSWNDGKKYFDTLGKVERWMGLCHGWAAASYMLPRPMHSVSTLSKTGQSITFYPSDIKALGTLLWAQSSYNTKFIGGRCNTENPQTDPNGRIIDKDCIDTNPASWHLSVLNQLGVSERSLIMDATYDYQVWNQPVIGYDVVFFNPQSFEASYAPEDATILIQDYQRDMFKQYRSVHAKSIVGVRMTVEYMVETGQSHRKFDSPDFDGIAKVTYYYDLELDEYGHAIGGEWYQNAHPDFLWTPTPDAQAISYYDVEGFWDVTQPIPQHWEEAAKNSSRYYQPLSSIVNTLFSASSASNNNNWQQLVTSESICLDVEGGRPFVGARIIGWPCHSADNQLWQLDSASNLVTKLSSSLCLDQEGSSVFLQECNDQSSQKWSLEQGFLTNMTGAKLVWSANSGLVTTGSGQTRWHWNKPNLIF
ncbi:ricin-type beta-trefoil lectin domain protein [Vibrio campbellii]|uniref:ricin-type beta-trefoil lectin domain protein n=1 Tax=Vibrio campbellii TaxID=680 RepID=UPI0003A0193A|nr:ricin-type beta-trefoil lectin domain protein [Vibrio campbellii]